MPQKERRKPIVVVHWKEIPLASLSQAVPSTVALMLYHQQAVDNKTANSNQFQQDVLWNYAYLRSSMQNFKEYWWNSMSSYNYQDPENKSQRDSCNLPVYY